MNQSGSVPTPPPKDDPWRGEKTQVENPDVGEENHDLAKSRRRRPFLHYLCCICCPCLPMWARYGCCVLFTLFVIFLIIVGILAALFKVPQVDFNGPTNHPDGLKQFETSNSSLAFSVNFGLKIGVVNPNIESITFESIRAIAYYPTAPTQSVGGGIINNVHINSNGITNFTFPFSIQYDPAKDTGYQMLSDIASKCGLLGHSTKEDLYVQYDLIPTIRVAGIAIAPTIHESSHFPCPISEGQLTAGLKSQLVRAKSNTNTTTKGTKSKTKKKDTSENEPDENEPDEDEPDENEKDES